MSSDVKDSLEAFDALDREAQKNFITKFAKEISVDNFRFLKHSILDSDRTQIDLVAALPVDALLNVYRYLEPTAHISHQLVCKKWREILTAKEFHCVHTAGWLKDTCTPLICQQKKEPEATFALRRLETMHRFQNGVPKWTRTFDIPYCPEPSLQMIGNIFMIGPSREGEIRLVNTLSGELSAHYLATSLDMTSLSQLWSDDDAVFFRLTTLTEETIHAPVFSTQTIVSLPNSPTSILHFVVNAQQTAILCGDDVHVSDFEVLFWNFHDGRIMKSRIAKLASMMPRTFAGRDLTDHVVKTHLNADSTILTVMLVGNFKESLKHDEQCVILLFKFKVPLESMMLCSQSTGCIGRRMQNAAPLQKNEVGFWDDDAWMRINIDRAEFTTAEWTGYSGPASLDAFMWKGITYSIPSALSRSRRARMHYYVTETPPIYVVSPTSDALIRQTTVAEELNVETWSEQRRPDDPFIVGNVQILIHGTNSEATVMVFDPDINILERFFMTDWDEPSFADHASSSVDQDG